ncbi:hypothetical protein LCI18_012854 [Fusarium solani-melongenae]|uniref:Uncharacterized protein n=1 Tax=Fusarium solani subsp. cucurbitae TaxID=2747967 RepID=A0ACD3ZKQ3_FUSSC|nr:hypothetical protein LCI18_012854 [Fusarium solani-melongenae]
MERVAHTATTVAAAVLKSAKPGDMRREDLQLNVFNCLALVTAYPVCLVNRIRGNTHDPCVVTLCNRAAKRLQQLRPIEKDDPETRSVTNTSSVTFQEGTRNEMEHFFEILSLQLEREFRTSSRSKLPSIAPQRVMFNIRNHLDDLADICDFGTFRTPLIRKILCAGIANSLTTTGENVDLMAMIGRESSVYAYSDNVKPIAFLWTFDIVARVLCLSLPIQTCTTLAWSMVGRAALEIAGISVITATALTILNEIWGLWDPYAKGVNIYSWTLGVAREIDAMLNDVYDSDRDRDKGLPLRKHGYDAWKIPSDKPRPSPADEELPRVVDELYEINHHLEALRHCREGI